MTPVYQTIFTDLNGNCLQAATASILDLPLSAVPNFCENRPSTWYLDWRAWLAARGFQVLWGTKDWAIDGLHIAFGTTAGGHRHAVVMHGPNLAHDPGGQNAPGLAEVDSFYVLVPHDPVMSAA